MKGYAGGLLRVRLDDGAVATEALPRRALEWYVGGAGLAARVLRDEVPPQADAYGSGNKVILMSGPLTGTEIPGAVNYSLVTRSPFGGFPVVTDARGSVGRKLKFAAFHSVVLEGASGRWCSPAGDTAGAWP